MQFQIVIEPPDTSANWTSFNRDCDDLNSDFLMQPINEADYDSETQACVDARTVGGPRSFYDHYVTKRRKKRGIKGLGVEHPARREGEHQFRVTPTNAVGFGGVSAGPLANAREEEWVDEPESNGATSDAHSASSNRQTAKQRKQERQAILAAERKTRANRFADPHEGVMGEATAAALASPTETKPSSAASSKPTKSGFLALPTNSVRTSKTAAPPGLASKGPLAMNHPGDFLDVPNKITAAKGALNNAAIRRIACGRNPTPVWNEPTGFKGGLPAPEDLHDSQPSPVSVEVVTLDAAQPAVTPPSVAEVTEIVNEDEHPADQKPNKRGNWTPDQFAIIIDGEATPEIK